MFKRLKRYGYTTDYLTFSDLLDKADSDLFCNMRRSYHCLHHVLPPLFRMVDNLRVRGHPYNLPECSTNVHKKIICCAFPVWFYIRFTGFITFSSTIYVLFCSTVVFCFICIASHCYVMSLLCLCAFVTLNKRLLTYLLIIASRIFLKFNVNMCAFWLGEGPSPFSSFSIGMCSVQCNVTYIGCITPEHLLTLQLCDIHITQSLQSVTEI